MKNKWYEIIGICALMMVLTVLSTYPLVNHLDTAIPFDSFNGGEAWNRSGDQLQLLYMFWLTKENLTGAVPFNTNPFEFNMVPPLPSRGFTTFPLDLLYFIFSPFGDITAYNLTIFSSYILAGTFMYLLVRLYTGSRIGALLGAIIFTFAPSRINGITGGNEYGFLFFCFPWIFYYLEKAVRSQKIRYGFLAGIGLVFLSMLEIHLLYYIALLLAAYIPFRLVALTSADRDSFFRLPPHVERFFSRPILRSLLFIWGSGVATVLYCQVLMSLRGQDSFPLQHFWWVFAIYPLIPVLIALCLASIYQYLSSLTFQQSIAVEANSMLPLYGFIPLSLLLYKDIGLATTPLVISVVTAVVALKLILLRSHLISMTSFLWQGLVAQKGRIWAVTPLGLAMAYVILWVPFIKVNTLNTTVVGSGRSLHDVKLYSAHLSDIFLSKSNVYFGIIPLLIIVILTLTTLWSLLQKKRDIKGEKRLDLIVVFYLTVAFISYNLALGLAFGKTSLYLLFYHYLPFFNYPRVSDRIIILALFSTAILAGFIIKRIQDRFSHKLWGVAIAFLALLSMGFQLYDYNLHKPMGINILNRGQDIYSYVKKNIGDGVLLEIPLWPGDSHQSSLYQHYIMLDEVPRVNGYSPVVQAEYLEKIFKPLDTLNHGKLGKNEYELLQKLGVKYITVHKNKDVFTDKVSSFGPQTTIRRFKNSPYLEFVNIKNAMYYKDIKRYFGTLFLFRVKEKSTVEVNENTEAWYEMPRFFSVNRRLYHEVGEIVKDETIGKNVFQALEQKHKPGYLVYGPYSHFPKGMYRCYFSVATFSNDENATVGRIEVAKVLKNGDQIILSEAELAGGKAHGAYKWKYIDFRLKDHSMLELRVFYHGTGDVRVNEIAVYKRNNDGPLGFMEAEKMVGETGLVKLEETASNGKVIEVVAGNNHKGKVVYGPNRIYSNGRYQARYYLRRKNAGTDKGSKVAAVLSITDGLQEKNYLRRPVRVEELSDQSFTAIAVEFTIPRDQSLSFQVHSTGKTSFQLDRIEVEKR